MLKFDALSLVEANYVMEFAQPVLKIRFEQARAEDAFGQLTNSQSQQTNVSDTAAPDEPRILFAHEKKAILISQVRCQMDFNFPPGGSIKERVAILGKNVNSFHRAALEKFNVAPYGVNALVVHLRAPSPAKPQEVQKYLHDKFFKIQIPIEIASARAALGYRQDDCFVNLAADVYETRKISVSGEGPLQRMVTTIVKGDLVESGLQVRLDVNNKPAAEQQGYVAPASADKLLALLDQFMNTHVQPVVGLPLE